MAPYSFSLNTHTKIEKGEFLLQSEPNVLIGVFFKRLHGDGSRVGGQRFSLRCPRITHDQKIIHSVGTRSERIPKDPSRFQNDFGIITRGLSGRTAIKVPFWQHVDRFRFLGIQRARFGTSVPIRINPHVFGQDLVGGERQGMVPVNHSRIQLGTTRLLRQVRRIQRSRRRTTRRVRRHKRQRGSNQQQHGQLHGRKHQRKISDRWTKCK